MSNEVYIDVDRSNLLDFMRRSITDIQEALVDNLERCGETDEMSLRVRAASQARLLYELNLSFGGLCDDDESRLIADLLANNLFY